MRAVFWTLVVFMRAGHFAWMAGWGVWLLHLTWTMFTGGSVFLPIVGGYLNFAYGNVLGGLVMLALGLPIGLTLSQFASVLLRMPGAAILASIANLDGNEDLAARARI